MIFTLKTKVIPNNKKTLSLIGESVFLNFIYDIVSSFSILSFSFLTIPKTDFS
ncbi:hypothetical protein CCAND38_700004 [Capnocytophaga canis]|uniref:Uncharacterized protein n=1 Tax=Capnocytophaga canis TaxID=1848903 RepID=A0A0B7IDZ7_9FLAO|nr:hypothetical protein CCAND38_700004 [Capnocytophaga canis]